MTTAHPQLLIPRLPRRTIERRALLDGWLRERHRLCHLVLGPAGSGKTTLALQWRRHLIESGFMVVWNSILPDDDLETLRPRLLAGFEPLGPEGREGRDGRVAFTRLGAPSTSGTSGTSAASSASSTSSAALAARLITRVAADGRDTMLVLDDYQHATRPQVHDLFQILLDHAPANLHLLIISRAEPPLSLRRFEAMERLHVIDWPRLAFSPDEAQALGREHAPALSADRVDRMRARTEGWAVGLRILMRMGSPSPAREIERGPARLARQIATYLQHEVFFHLAPHELHALVRLSPTRRFNDALATLVLGAESSQHLMALLRRHRLFVQPTKVAGDTAWWRFHPQLRALLLERFAQMPDEHQRRTRIGLGQWFGERGMLRDAVELLVAAGECAAAADQIEQQAEALFHEGGFSRLLRAVAALPSSPAAPRPSLLAWVAWSQLGARQFGLCAQSLAALERLDPGPTGASQPMLCLLRAALALQTDDLAAAQSVVPALLEMRDARQAMLLGGRRNLLAWYFAQQGMADEARRRLTGPAHHLADGRVLRDSPFGALMSEVLHGMTWLQQGEFRRAEAVLRAAHAQAVRSAGPGSLAACSAAGLLAEVLHETDDPQGARQLIAVHGRAIEQQGLPDVMLSATLARSRLAVDSGSIVHAHEALDGLMAHAHAHGMLRLEAVLRHERFSIALSTREELTARQEQEALRRLSEQALRAQHPAAGRIAQWAGLAQARWLAHQLRDEQALAAVKTLMSQGALCCLLQIRTGALGAVLMARGSHEGSAVRQTLQMVQLARSAGIAHSLLTPAPEFAGEFVGLLHRVRELGLADEDVLLALYLERLLGPPPQVAARRSGPPLSARETQILSLLMQDLPNRRIADALGVSAETVRWHLKNLYPKLSVARRREAIRVARDLGMGGAH